MKVIKLEQMYTSATHFVCDRSKNYLCPRVKSNLPCGDCKGTRYIEFAKEFEEEIHTQFNIKVLLQVVYSIYVRVLNFVKGDLS